MKPTLRGFDDGIWFFHNIRDEFLLSKSVRADFMDAILAHHDQYKQDWTKQTPDSDAPFSAAQHR